MLILETALRGPEIIAKAGTVGTAEEEKEKNRRVGTAKGQARESERVAHHAEMGSTTLVAALRAETMKIDIAMTIGIDIDPLDEMETIRTEKEALVAAEEKSTNQSLALERRAVVLRDGKKLKMVKCLSGEKKRSAEDWIDFNQTLQQGGGGDFGMISWEV